MYMSIIKVVLTTLAALFAAVVLAGCHTVEGAGRDVEAAGSGVADTADEVRPYDRDAQPRY
jgi:predicted small secreted protein